MATKIERNNDKQRGIEIAVIEKRGRLFVDINDVMLYMSTANVGEDTGEVVRQKVVGLLRWLTAQHVWDEVPRRSVVN